MKPLLLTFVVAFALGALFASSAVAVVPKVVSSTYGHREYIISRVDETSAKQTVYESYIVETAFDQEMFIPTDCTGAYVGSH